jgi:hypothetical protein
MRGDGKSTSKYHENDVRDGAGGRAADAHFIETK